MNDNATVPDVAGLDLTDSEYTPIGLTDTEKLDLLIAHVRKLDVRVAKLEQMADLVISLAHGMENNPMFKMFAKKK